LFNDEELQLPNAAAQGSAHDFFYGILSLQNRYAVAAGEDAAAGGTTVAAAATAGLAPLPGGIPAGAQRARVHLFATHVAIESTRLL
jgi:hypothetical protein